jgi:hypothetical protein
MPQPEIVIIGKDGTEHVFPPGTDPQIAARTVRTHDNRQSVLPPRVRAGEAPEQAPDTATSRADRWREREVAGMTAEADSYRDMGQLYKTHGPSELVGGAQDIAQGNVARGAHRMLSGGTVTAAPIVAPLAIRAMVQTPVMTALGFGAGTAGHVGGQATASALGATEDQAMLAGDLTSLAAGGATSLLPGRTVRVPGPFRPTQNPAEQAAVALGERRGVPLDAGTRTGSQFVKNVQKRSGSLWGGANVAENAQTAQRGALERVGRELASETGAAASTPVTAGEGVQAGLTAGVQGYHRIADTAYDRFRSLTKGVTVDMRATKAALKPIYTRLMREKDIAPPQGDKARATQALDRLINGPDAEDIGIVEAALGDIKALARTADLPELRTQGQGLAAKAVEQLDQNVIATARRAGPDALTALQEGRSATVSKFDVAGVRDMFGDEPRAVFNALTARRDAGLNRLREVQRVAPQEVPNVARAFLDDLVDTATADGQFSHTDKLAAEWSKLGDATKAMLFPNRAHRRDLDAFFVLAKRIGHNPNPSGTAQTTQAQLNFTQALAGIPSWAVARALYNPRSARLLTEGLTVSMRRAPAAQQSSATLVTRALREAGVSSEGLPAAAEGDDQIPGPGDTGSPAR